MKGTGVLPRARATGLVIKELHGETLVYDLERNEAHCLNQTAALVWKWCDGRTRIERITGLLQKQFDASVDPDLVWLALKELRRFHLIEESENVFAPAPVSRRKLVLKYAPAAALVLPLIVSIIAPTAAAAATDPCAAPTGRPDTCPCTSDNDCASQNCNMGTCGPQLKPNPGGGFR